MTAPDSSYEPAYDPQTLQPLVDAEAAVTRVADLRQQAREPVDEVAEFVARGELIDLLLATGASAEAVDEAERAVDRAIVTGTAPQQHLARLRLAAALDAAGSPQQAGEIFDDLQADGNRYGPVIAAHTHEQLGRRAYTAGNFAAAHEHFLRALAVREEFELPASERVLAQLGLEASARRREQP